MLIKGKDLFFYIQINGVYIPLCHARTCTINTNAATLPTTTYLSGKAETNDYSGKYSYTIKGEGLNDISDYANNFTLQSLQTSFTKINWTFTDDSHVQWSGTAIITSTTFDSNFDGISSFENELLGDGEYTFVQSGVIPIPPVGAKVNIIDQFGSIIASLTAPDNYVVTRFNVIDCGAANQPEPLITITA